MSILTTYNPNSYLPFRFSSLCWQGIKTTPSVENHQPNLIEKTGNLILWGPENAPRIIKKVCTSPQVITIVAFTALHLANSYAFYPTQTTQAVNFVIEYIPIISRETIKFGLWFSSSSIITGLCARVGGRLTESYINRLQGIETPVVVANAEQ